MAYPGETCQGEAVLEAYRSSEACSEVEALHKSAERRKLHQTTRILQVRFCRCGRFRCVESHECLVFGELPSQLLLGQCAVFNFGPLRRGLGDGSSSEPEFDSLATLVICHIWCRNPFHPEIFHFISVSSWKCIVDAKQATKKLLISDAIGRPGRNRRTFPVQACELVGYERPILLRCSVASDTYYI